MGEQLPGMPLPPPSPPVTYDVEMMFLDRPPRYWYGVSRALFSQDGSWFIIEQPDNAVEFVNAAFVESVYSEPS